MKTPILVGLLLLAVPALAQQPSNPPIPPVPPTQPYKTTVPEQTTKPEPTTNPTAGEQSIREIITQKLTDKGYKNIKINPASFFAEATNADGNPVMMIITPDSITTFVGDSAASDQPNNNDNNNNKQ